MFSTTTTLAALLFTASTINAIPIWSRIATLAVRADPTTPAEIAQGSNFFFDSLRLEDACTPTQIGCISSQLATCSQEGNWEITPCTANTTCLAVPASDNTGVFVSCILFADAQTDIGSQDVSVDFGLSSPPNNTATAAIGSSTPTQTGTDSLVPTTESSTDSTVDPTDSSTDPTPTSDAGSDPTTSSSDDGSDPSATCTDDAPEATETELITVIIQPNPTQPGELVTTTLFPNETTTATSTDDTVPTSTDDSTVPTPTDSNDVTGTDAATTTSIPDPAVTEQPIPSTSASTSTNGTCTEDPTATDSTDPTGTFTDGVSTEYGTSPTATDSVDPSTQTGLTLTIPPNFSVPPTTTATTSTATTATPANNVAPTPSVSAGADVSVIGTHAIPAPASPSAPARMMRVRRA